MTGTQDPHHKHADLDLKANEDEGYEEVFYEGQHIATLTPLDHKTVGDAFGGYMVEYGTSFALDTDFHTKKEALDWIAENAGDLADPDNRDYVTPF